MSIQTRDPVLRRKVAPPTPKPEPAAALQGPACGLRRAFAKAVSATAGLVVEKDAIQRRSVSLNELLDCIEPDAFVAMLSAGDAGPSLAVLDQSGFGAVIEAMTIGRLSPKPPVPRRPTPTDSSLLAELWTMTLRALTCDRASALHVERAVPDLRLLTVLLEDVTFDLVEVEATLIKGQVRRDARIMLALPRLATPVGVRGDDAGHETSADDSWSQALEASVLRAPATLRAELGRITLPLSDVLDLGVGGALVLPLSNLEEVQLVALDGSVQAVGRLGQARGMRAMRLTSWPNAATPDPKMTELAATEPPPRPEAARLIKSEMSDD